MGRLDAHDVVAQCSGQPAKLGGTDRHDDLLVNLVANCVPESALTHTVADFEDFLTERRALMASKIRSYYLSL